jgi:hypothetical protein
MLPLDRFLKRQPLNNFWALVVTLNSDVGWVEYLSRVDPPEDGSVPFRFESEGELRYYVKSRQLGMKKYQLAEFKSWN